MRIAIFTDAYLPEINGVTTSIELFRAELLRLGHEVYIVAPNYNRNQEEGTWVIRFPSIPYFFPQMRERRFVFPSFRKLFKLGKLGIDIIHSQVPGNMGVYALWASRWFRIPHIHTYHTLYMQYTHYVNFPTAFSTRAVRWISQHFLGRCQRAVAPSRQIRDELHSYGVDCPIDVIPTGIEPQDRSTLKSATEVKRRFSIPEEAPLLCYVGRIGREKNIGFLLEMFARLRRRLPSARFVIVGDGPERQRLMRKAYDLGLGETVRFAGYIPRYLVFSVCRAADLFVFASKTETQGLVILEAMSVGTPVVAVDAMGVSDLQADGRGGFLSPPQVSVFTDRVEQMLTDRELREEKAREAEAKADEWSMRNMTKKLVASYQASIADYRQHGLPRYRRRPWVPIPVAPLADQPSELEA
jgi:glycosyltransferase involved in cell wall biosynthesis